MHDNPFRVHLRNDKKALPYPHETEYTQKVYNRRVDRGEVWTAKPNFSTSPAQRGNPSCFPKGTLGPKPEFIGDDYEARRKRDFAEHKLNRAKMQDAQWKDVSPGNRPFVSEKETFGMPDSLSLPATARPRAGDRPRINQVEHDRPFKYSSPGKRGQAGRGVTIGEYPKHIADPVRFPVRRSSEEDKPPAWKNTYRGLSKPTPSVQQLPKNIMSDVRRSLRI